MRLLRFLTFFLIYVLALVPYAHCQQPGPSEDTSPLRWIHFEPDQYVARMPTDNFVEGQTQYEILRGALPIQREPAEFPSRCEFDTNTGTFRFQRIAHGFYPETLTIREFRRDGTFQQIHTVVLAPAPLGFSGREVWVPTGPRENAQLIAPAQQRLKFSVGYPNTLRINATSKIGRPLTFEFTGRAFFGHKNPPSEQGLPEGMILDQHTGMLSWTAKASPSRPKIFRVSDDLGNSVEVQVFIEPKDAYAFQREAGYKVCTDSLQVWKQFVDRQKFPQLKVPENELPYDKLSSGLEPWVATEAYYWWGYFDFLTREGSDIRQRLTSEQQVYADLLFRFWLEYVGGQVPGLVCPGILYDDTCEPDLNSISPAIRTALSAYTFAAVPEVRILAANQAIQQGRLGRNWQENIWQNPNLMLALLKGIQEPMADLFDVRAHGSDRPARKGLEKFEQRLKDTSGASMAEIFISYIFAKPEKFRGLHIFEVADGERPYYESSLQDRKIENIRLFTKKTTPSVACNNFWARVELVPQSWRQLGMDMYVSDYDWIPGLHSWIAQNVGQARFENSPSYFAIQFLPFVGTALFLADELISIRTSKDEHGRDSEWNSDAFRRVMEYGFVALDISGGLGALARIPANTKSFITRNVDNLKKLTKEAATEADQLRVLVRMKKFLHELVDFGSDDFLPSCALNLISPASGFMSALNGATGPLQGLCAKAAGEVIPGSGSALSLPAVAPDTAVWLRWANLLKSINEIGTKNANFGIKLQDNSGNFIKLSDQLKDPAKLKELVDEAARELYKRSPTLDLTQLKKKLNEDLVGNLNITLALEEKFLDTQTHDFFLTRITLLELEERLKSFNVENIFNAKIRNGYLQGRLFGLATNGVINPTITRETIKNKFAYLRRLSDWITAASDKVNFDSLIDLGVILQEIGFGLDKSLVENSPGDLLNALELFASTIISLSDGQAAGRLVYFTTEPKQVSALMLLAGVRSPGVGAAFKLGKLPAFGPVPVKELVKQHSGFHPVSFINSKFETALKSWNPDKPGTLWREQMTYAWRQLVQDGWISATKQSNHWVAKFLVPDPLASVPEVDKLRFAQAQKLRNRFFAQNMDLAGDFNFVQDFLTQRQQIDFNFEQFRGASPTTRAAPQFDKNPFYVGLCPQSCKDLKDFASEFQALFPNTYPIMKNAAAAVDSISTLPTP